MAAAKQQIRFCTSHDGARIAYANSGQGPPLLKVANWLSHLEFDWESPVWRPLLTELSRDYTLIRYDERGCGLSDWDVADLSFEAWVRDLETVVDATGVDRFPLLGLSQGASIAVAYAVRHPERVTHLILHGGYARGRLRRSPTQQQCDEAEGQAREDAVVRAGEPRDRERQAEPGGGDGAHPIAQRMKCQQYERHAKRHQQLDVRGVRLDERQERETGRRDQSGDR